MVARKKEMIPEHFKTIEAAGDFWDTHSLADYSDQTQEIEMEFDLRKRTRYIAVSEEVYSKLVRQARRKHSTVREMVLNLAKGK